MAFMQWSEMLVIDGGVIDTQHHTLVDAVNALHAAVIQGHEADAVAATLSTLETYGVQHFGEEEAMLAHAHYPRLDQHRRQHLQFLEQVAAFRVQLAQGGAGLGHGMAQFLGGWLVNHIMVADKAYASFLRSSSARLAAIKQLEA